MPGRVALMSSSAVANAKITLMPKTAERLKVICKPDTACWGVTQRYHTNMMLATLQSSSSFSLWGGAMMSCDATAAATCRMKQTLTQLLKLHTG